MENDTDVLRRVAYDVADSYRAGDLSHLTRPEWRLTWKNLTDEVERRCPGFSKPEYDKALNDGFTDSR
jgi:hypothetical protein